jgi:hypothetical protein
MNTSNLPLFFLQDLDQSMVTYVSAASSAKSSTRSNLVLGSNAHSLDIVDEGSIAIANAVSLNTSSLDSDHDAEARARKEIKLFLSIESQIMLPHSHPLILQSSPTNSQSKQSQNQKNEQAPMHKQTEHIQISAKSGDNSSTPSQSMHSGTASASSSSFSSSSSSSSLSTSQSTRTSVSAHSSSFSRSLNITPHLPPSQANAASAQLSQLDSEIEMSLQVHVIKALHLMKLPSPLSASSSSHRQSGQVPNVYVKVLLHVDQDDSIASLSANYSKTSTTYSTSNDFSHQIPSELNSNAPSVVCSAIIRSCQPVWNLKQIWNLSKTWQLAPLAASSSLSLSSTTSTKSIQTVIGAKDTAISSHLGGANACLSKQHLQNLKYVTLEIQLWHCVDKIQAGKSYHNSNQQQQQQRHLLLHQQQHQQSRFVHKNKQIQAADNDEDVLIGTATVNLQALAAGIPRLDGWYHVYRNINNSNNDINCDEGDHDDDDDDDIARASSVEEDDVNDISRRSDANHGNQDDHDEHVAASTLLEHNSRTVTSSFLTTLSSLSSSSSSISTVGQVYVSVIPFAATTLQQQELLQQPNQGQTTSELLAAETPEFNQAHIAFSPPLAKSNQHSVTSSDKISVNRDENDIHSMLDNANLLNLSASYSSSSSISHQSPSRRSSLTSHSANTSTSTMTSDTSMSSDKIQKYQQLSAVVKSLDDMQRHLDQYFNRDQKTTILQTNSKPLSTANQHSDIAHVAGSLSLPASSAIHATSGHGASVSAASSSSTSPHASSSSMYPSESHVGVTASTSISVPSPIAQTVPSIAKATATATAVGASSSTFVINKIHIEDRGIHSATSTSPLASASLNDSNNVNNTAISPNESDNGSSASPATSVTMTMDETASSMKDNCSGDRHYSQDGVINPDMQTSSSENSASLADRIRVVEQNNKSAINSGVVDSYDILDDSNDGKDEDDSDYDEDDDEDDNYHNDDNHNDDNYISFVAKNSNATNSKDKANNGIFNQNFGIYENDVSSDTNTSDDVYEHSQRSKLRSDRHDVNNHGNENGHHDAGEIGDEVANAHGDANDDTETDFSEDSYVLDMKSISSKQDKASSTNSSILFPKHNYNLPKALPLSLTSTLQLPPLSFKYYTALSSSETSTSASTSVAKLPVKSSSSSTFPAVQDPGATSFSTPNTITQSQVKAAVGVDSKGTIHSRLVWDPRFQLDSSEGNRINRIAKIMKQRSNNNDYMTRDNDDE